MSNKIAVIGLAGRFPGAKNIGEYWDNLLNGRETITYFDDEVLAQHDPSFEKLKDRSDFVKARGILNDIDKFDASFFGITPLEAAATDPQHRLWLQTAWDAFENAGVDPLSFNGSIGVFAGGTVSMYLLNNVLRDPEKLEHFIRFRGAEAFHYLLSNDPGYLATRTAYKFNLKGPAINVSTACSTSLVAIAQACQSLYTYESDMCIAGGVCITVPQENGYLFQEGAILSPDGHCRPFDASAMGTVASNGVGAVILKRLDDAVRDGDPIYAVVRGWALNNDGSNKLSYTAPSVDGQAEAIVMAQAFADVSPDDISYIEAHGTATQLGDPVEIAGLTKAFARKTSRKQFCGIGSVKSNIGHTDSAAGVASFIKASMIACNKKIPPTLHYKSPNPHIDFKNSPFYVVDALTEYRDTKPLIMGISSFGIGGTNSHVILEEPPVQSKEQPAVTGWPELLVVSAKSEESLKRRKTDLARFVASNPAAALSDIALTLKTGRNHMRYRSFAIASSTTDLASQELKYYDGASDENLTRLAFMFPGQGAQYPGMGAELYTSNRVFRATADECFRIYQAETGEDISKIIFSSSNDDAAAKRLSETAVTQPALFIIEYALATMLIRGGLKPECLAGHSIGEYTAACVAGVFDLPTAMKIVIRRGQLMQSMPGGMMLVARTGAGKLESIRNGLFEIAADNGTEFCTISFSLSAGDQVKKLLDDNGIQYIRLDTSHAFHSADFEPILGEFADYVNSFSLSAPKIPFVSCLSGEIISNEQALSGAYWAKQLRNTVQFRKGIARIAGSGDFVFLEVGPNTHLTSIVRQNEAVTNRKAVIPTLGKPAANNEKERILTAAGQLFNVGLAVDFNPSEDDRKPSKIFLPGYPFEEKRHWIDADYSVFLSGKTKKADRDQDKTPDPDQESTENGAMAGLSLPDKNRAVMVSIWKSVFGMSNIGPDDNFFEIGGHSLMALQILNRIREEFNRNFPLKTFLENPTVNMLLALFGEEELPAAPEQKYKHSTNLTRLPLSDDQKRLWIISQLDGLNPAYNISFTYELKGQLDIDIFRESIDRLFNRHHIVFSTFFQDNGETYCRIDPQPVNIEYLDFSNEPADEAKKRIMSLITADTRTSFDIEKGPLYRLFLYKYEKTAWYFHVNIHHMIFDGWSWGVLIRDLNIIYNGLTGNKEPDLKNLEIQFYDHAAWQLENKQGLNEEKLAEFWKGYLKDCPTVMNFPYDKIRKANPQGHGETEYISIPAEYTTRLRELSKAGNSTMFATMLSAFGTLLHKYTGDSDLVIGTPVSNRPNSEVEDIFGMFVNTIAVRLGFEKGTTFNSLVSRVKESAIEAISHQDLPFEKVVEVVNPDRVFNINPIFQICFAWQNNLSLPLDLSGVKGERITIEEGIAPFDLTLYLWESGDIIEGEIEFNSEIITRESARNLKKNFISLIAAVTSTPDKAVDAIEIITPSEKALIEKINQTGTDYPRDKNIVQLFAEQVALYPDKPALVFKDEVLSYRELDKRSGMLAVTLREAGVKDGEPVAIVGEKSNEFIIGILAILKAGAGYVPIDPDFPANRISFILCDSGSRLILIQDKFSHLNYQNFTTINLNKPESYSGKPLLPVSDIDPAGLVYIMYTSGTTGTPKGSMIPHRGVVRLVRNTNYIEFTPDDRVMLTSAIVFDVSTFEIWGALLNGATLYITPKETILNPRELGEELKKNKITVLWLTSALFTQIAEARSDIFSGLKYLLAGGDVLSAPHITKVRRANPSVKVVNGYGPTENTTFSTTFLIEKDYESNIPIGLPISNSTTWIFDKYLNHQPVGIIGELYVGGDGLSIGYLNRDDLNRKSFVYNPHNPSERLYRTGDYARWLPDGTIEFHGRIDKQLKIRGFRVELEEIAAAITEFEGVVETVIKPVKVSEGDLRLVAFLNITDDFKLTTKEITALLAVKLPSYMIPAIFKTMKGFPTTINGKVNMSLLVADVDELPDKEQYEAEDLSTDEKIIYDIWCESLRTKEISSKDNFFTIGGNSLLAISLMAKIEEAFNLNLGLRVFFDSPRIRDLAVAVSMARLKTVARPADRENQTEVTIVDGEI